MNPKVINNINARLARIEALLENSDVFKAQGGTTYGGLQYEGSQYNYNFGSDSQGFGPQDLGQEMSQNYGFGPGDMAIFEMQQRIAELELLIANGSNDTNQSGALDAGAGVGDDASDGSGVVTPTPEETADALGLGSMAYQDSTGVSVTGGTITGCFLSGSRTFSIATSGGITVATIGSQSDGGYLILYDESGGNQATIQVTASGGLEVTGSAGTIIASSAGGTTLGFYGSAGTSKPQVNGSRGGNAALASLISALAGLNLLTDSTTP